MSRARDGSVRLEHRQRLALAARVAELVPYTPASHEAVVLEGRAGQVPLRLALRADGTLELHAEIPAQAPEGMELRRRASGELRLGALNPAAARRLVMQPEVSKALNALFEAAPRAKVSRNAVLLSVASAAEEEQLRRAVRVALQAAWALAEASCEQALLAVQNRERAQGTPPSSVLGEGRRFIRLALQETWVPELPEAQLREVLARLSWGHPPERVHAWLCQNGVAPELASHELGHILRTRDEAYRQQGKRELLWSGASLLLIAGGLLFGLPRVSHYNVPVDFLLVSLSLLGGSYCFYRAVVGFERLFHGSRRESQGQHAWRPE